LQLSQPISEHFIWRVDQLIIERGCVHLGVTVPAHDNLLRCELRGESYDPNGTRHFPLIWVWKANS
jgi:hypothetical protein